MRASSVEASVINTPFFPGDAVQSAQTGGVVVGVSGKANVRQKVETLLGCV